MFLASTDSLCQIFLNLNKTARTFRLQSRFKTRSKSILILFFKYKSYACTQRGTYKFSSQIGIFLPSNFSLKEKLITFWLLSQVSFHKTDLRVSKLAPFNKYHFVIPLLPPRRREKKFKEAPERKESLADEPFVPK